MQESLNHKNSTWENKKINFLKNLKTKISSLVFFIIMNSSAVFADMWAKNEHVVQKDENAWRIVFNLTKSYKKASYVDNLVVYSWDIFIISDEWIIVTRDWKEIFKTLFNEENKEKKRSEPKSYKSPKDAVVDRQTTEIPADELSNSTLNEKRSIKEYFSSMTIEERFFQLTSPVSDWYYKIKFPDNLDTDDIFIEDIIPEKYTFVTIFKDTERFYKNKNWRVLTSVDNYFDILRRNIDWTFSSIFSWKKYNGPYKPENWYLLKLESFNQEFQDLSNPIISPNLDSGWYNNEMVIRSLYGELVSKNILEFFWEDSVIDETFFYSIIARESSFDPNSVSWFWTRWLCMVTWNTVLHILEENKNTLDRSYREINPELAEFNSSVISWEYEIPDFDNKYEEFLVEPWDFIPVWKEIKLPEKWEKRSINWIGIKLYDPKISILLALNYLKSLEDIFSFINDKKLKRDLIAVSYNMWRWIPRYIVRNDPSISDISWLIFRLQELVNRTGMFKDTDLYEGILTNNKIEEVVNYVEAVNGFDRDSRKNTQDYTLALN